MGIQYSLESYEAQVIVGPSTATWCSVCGCLCVHLILITFQSCSDFAVICQRAREPGLILSSLSLILSQLLSVCPSSKYFCLSTCLRNDCADHLMPNLFSLLCFSLQHFKLLVDELHVKGEGKVKNAMKESFKILNEVCLSEKQPRHLLGLNRMSCFKNEIALCFSGCSAGPRQPVQPGHHADNRRSHGGLPGRF